MQTIGGALKYRLVGNGQAPTFFKVDADTGAVTLSRDLKDDSLSAQSYQVMMSSAWFIFIILYRCNFCYYCLRSFFVKCNVCIIISIFYFLNVFFYGRYIQRRCFVLENNQYIIIFGWLNVDSQKMTEGNNGIYAII